MIETVAELGNREPASNPFVLEHFGVNSIKFPRPDMHETQEKTAPAIAGN
ncbi:hypothetical protein [Falsochrobactrum shanghaiense]|nr:hypothetical protein [Falsochrobactrum shanghaiense]